MVTRLKLYHYTLALAVPIALWGLFNWLNYTLSDQSHSMCCAYHKGVLDEWFTSDSLQALFAGLAFSFLILGVYIQREQLKVQQDELSEAQRLMTEETKQTELNAETNKRQQFDTTFFNMVRVWNDNSNVTIKWNHPTTESIRMSFPNFLGKMIDGSANEVISSYEQRLHEDTSTPLSQYFRTLYSITKFVDRSTLSEADKLTYIKYLRALLSSAEQQMMFYNGLSKFGYPKSYYLINKYHLLAHMSTNSLKVHRNFYSDSAFDDDVEYSLTLTDLPLTTDGLPAVNSK